MTKIKPASDKHGRDNDRIPRHRIVTPNVFDAYRHLKELGIMSRRSPGIDYGYGNSNRDPDTGIRYGVISQNSCNPDAVADMEAVYPEIEHDGGDRCERDVCNCGEYNDPIAFTYKQDGYHLSSGTDGFGIFVEKSPFYTLARFCSPCAPGAGDLDSTDPDGVKTYCLGHDWFEGGVAPYPVYSVEFPDVLVTPIGGVL